MATTYIVDKDGNQIDAASATVPSDRHFRNAWAARQERSLYETNLTRAEQGETFDPEICLDVNFPHGNNA